MDELVFPAVTSLKHPGEGADVTDDRIGLSFSRLLTPTLAFGVESGWMHRNWGPSQTSGFDTTSLSLKGLLYKNDLHETMLSAGLAWGIHGSGAQGVGASRPDTIIPASSSERDLAMRPTPGVASPVRHHRCGDAGTPDGGHID